VDIQGGIDDRYRELVARTGPYVEVATSGDTECGRRGDGTIECWGDDAAFLAVPNALRP
jgi:hypothetical protein